MKPASYKKKNQNTCILVPLAQEELKKRKQKRHSSYFITKNISTYITSHAYIVGFTYIGQTDRRYVFGFQHHVTYSELASPLMPLERVRVLFSSVSWLI